MLTKRLPILAALLGAWIAGPGLAVAAQSGFSGHNTNDPIRFSADKLEVKKEGRVATFSGDVEAVQGNMTLLASTVRVYYRAQKEEDQATGGFGGAVSRIDTQGNVHISSRGDTATGDWAVYDVERRIVTVGGKVVLQQGDTVVRGSRLELDLTTGQSRFRGLPSSDTDQRVRGEFTPVSKDKPDQQ